MFVEYESHRAAALARKKLVQGSVFLFGQEIGQVLINGNWTCPVETDKTNEWKIKNENNERKNDVPPGGLG